ncbi:serine/arginine repetitive matrix protein 1 isoform X1 [Neoarius graeffei]|uniref:serine/arginine repetitive matrix protein 1 isoform X1 n=1 Tax=Neoarius graeffei TaxID=443677 RepID=UPI00298D3A65|nr:serine/arginine repetitive matrix protein 1 isoform X1 [Neoarius graeffei]
MTNLQSLSIFLTERLMLAAQEIFKAVEVTVTEYHDEISRSRQENELLKSRLLEAGIQVYPELQPGLSVFHVEPCAGTETEDPGEKLQVKREPSVSRDEPHVPLPPPPPSSPSPPPPQTSVLEEPISPTACLEDEQRIEEMLHPEMTDSSVSPLLQAHQCMQIKEETDDSKSVLGTEIFCMSQSSTSDDPSSAAAASNHASGHETELDELSSMHNASEMPLSSKEKTAHHRQWVNSDPKARVGYLARRKERSVASCHSSRLRIHLLETHTPSLTPPPPHKKRKTAAEATRDWKDRLKQNEPERWAEYIQRGREATKAYRKNCSEEKKAIQREQSRLRMQAMRARKKAEQPEQPRLTRAAKEEQREKWRQAKAKWWANLHPQKQHHQREKRAQREREKRANKRVSAAAASQPSSSPMPQASTCTPLSSRSQGARRKAKARAYAAFPHSPCRLVDTEWHCTFP